VRIGEGKYPDIVAEPLVGIGLLYVSAYFDPLVALDLETKRSRWVVEVGSAAPAALDVGPIGPVLYHPGTDGKLRALDPATGDERWTWSSGDDGALTHPVPVEAGVFVGSTTGTLWLVDGTTGETQWTYSPPFVVEGLSGAPAIDGRQLIFATHAGRLHSLVAPKPTVAPTGAHYELERRLEIWTPPAREPSAAKRRRSNEPPPGPSAEPSAPPGPSEPVSEPTEPPGPVAEPTEPPGQPAQGPTEPTSADTSAPVETPPTP
jgi:hypothetical protein